MIYKKMFACLTLLLLLTSTAYAETSLRGGRIGAQDAVALSEFYKQAFGLHEVNRFIFPDGGIEVMLNFGSTQAEAKANTNAVIVLMPRESDDITDTLAHLIFNVDDIHAAMAAVENAGGQLETEEPIAILSGPAQMFVAIGIDPAGNLIEMLQPPGQ